MKHVSGRSKGNQVQSLCTHVREHLGSDLGHEQRHLNFPLTVCELVVEGKDVRVSCLLALRSLGQYLVSAHIEKTILQVSRETYSKRSGVSLTNKNTLCLKPTRATKKRVCAAREANILAERQGIKVLL